MEVLFILALITLVFLVLSMFEMPAQTYKKHCSVHKWVLVDAEGEVPEDAPLDRKHAAVLICKECGRVPRRKEEGEL